MQRPILSFAILGLLAAVFCSPALAANHLPVTLTVKYKGEMLPVTKVIGSDPVVMVDRQDKRIRTTPRYQPQIGGEFSSQKLEIISASFDGAQSLDQPKYNVADLIRSNSDNTISRYTRPEINLTLKAPQDLEGAFIVIGVEVPLSDENTSQGTHHFVVRALPHLSAEATTAIQITDRYLTFPREQPNLAILVFDAQGRQILTNATSNS